MTVMRWSLAAAATLGGLGLIAAGCFFLLVLSGVMAPGGSGAGLYWIVSLVAVLAVGTWLLLVVWCGVDASRREMNGVLWAILVFVLGFPVGPLVYLVLRRNTAPERAANP